MTGYDMSVPGTVHLIDLEGTMHLSKDGHAVVLIPQPSSNINDPLRWSNRKKYLQFSLLWIWSFLLAAAVNFTGPLWTEWTVVFNCSFAELNNSSALTFVFLGLGCLFLQPTALKLGRRAVYLGCSVIVIVSTIIGSQASHIGHIYAASILSGFAAAPVDSLVEISSTDVFFLHQRSTIFSWLILALYFGSDLAPVAAGYIYQSMGWKWCYYFQIIIFAVLLIIQFFVMEDTTFRREYDDETSGEVEDLSDKEASPSIEKGNELVEVQEGVDSNSDLTSLDLSIPLRTYWQKMKIIQREYNDTRHWTTIWYRPFFLAAYPAVIWAGLIYGAQMMWLMLLATTQSEVYSVPPYNFSTASVGLTNLAPCVGSLFGMLYGGPFTDWLNLYLSRRNGGIMEPEFKLWAMIVPTIINAAGLIAYGIGITSESHWAISVIIGQGFLGFSMASTGPICLTYAVDCYEKVSSEALVIILFSRNLIGMMFCFVIQPWIDACGLTLTTWLMFMLSIVINMTFVIMIIWGKEFRRWTMKSYLKYSNPHYGAIFRSKV